jgi:hypothetical protein
MEMIWKILGKTLFAASLLALSAHSMAGADQFRGTFWEIVSCPTADGYSEEIYLEGSYRILSQYVEGNGHVTSTFQIFWDADGMGPSGSEYLLNGKWMEVIQGNPPYIFLWNDHFRLIGKGRAENFEIHFKIRMIVNANGELVVDYLDATACETIDSGFD